MSRWGGGAKCPVCSKTVYLAEEVLAEGNKFHKTCFKCSECNKALDSSTATGHEGVLYCRACYGHNFSPEGFGYGQRAGVVNSENGGERTTGVMMSESGGERIGYQPIAKGGSSRFGGGDKCSRCNKSVYAAERVIGAGSSWHKGCFNCSSCNKKLDSTTVSDKDGEIYCKGCYGKQFGPKGFGYGQGAGALTMTT